ncbi:hypothetical protein GCM10009678_00310 [Actinomadura kijaniata]|uniref:YCII-related domain-containing protein n=1 Tax=Actinomadura namibiensis TaxID=182080 RepID=A0A7W3QNV5_ACTNM|nr:hypothetical protein [Actinomadura namibiensis]
MKYVLMFAETEEFARHLAAMSESERQEEFARVGEWFAEHAAHITHHSRLQPPHTATTVRLTGDQAVVTDGPFVEGKEVVSGFAELDVADLDQALAIAAAWPGCPVVEIRPLV